MAGCLGELHIWSLKNQTILSDADIGCFTYHDKGETVNNSEQPYYEEKHQYTNSRDNVWTLKNKRPEKMRDSLKEAEDLLLSNKCIYCKWKSHRLLQAILSNGIIIYFVLNDVTADVERVFIDKSLVGKLCADNATDVIVEENFLAFSYLEKTKLDYVYLSKRSTDGARKLDKLTMSDSKISQVDLPGPSGRRLERKLSCNVNRDLVLAWWATASAEAWPWAPMTSDRERANLVILLINGPNIEVLCYARTDCDPVFASFSEIQPHKVYTIEQVTGKDMSIESCTYEISRTTIPIKLQKTSVTSIPSRNGVISYGRNISEDKLLMGCADGSLLLYDEQKKVTQTAKSKLIPSTISWHPSGSLVIVGSARGEIQVFDAVLSPLKIQLLSENVTSKHVLELGTYFRSPPTLGMLQCCPYEGVDSVVDCSFNVMLAFDRGPFCILNVKLGVTCMAADGLTPQILINEYIRYQQIDEAVSLLCAMNWDIEGSACLACMTRILDNLLRNPLSPQREAQLEAVLGCFYAPARPLAEVTVLEYRDPISRYARRFFHHLLRYSRFEKAYLLAVDVGARDLFMDIHYLALDKGELALADVAKAKADQIESESVSTDTESFDDGADTSYSTESFEEFNINGDVNTRQEYMQAAGNRYGQQEHWHSMQRRNPVLSETPNAVPLFYEEERGPYREYQAAINQPRIMNPEGTLSDDENQVFYI